MVRPCPACPPVACARRTGLGSACQLEYRGADIAIVERVAALAGLAVGGTHEHDLALVVDGGGAHDVEAR